MPDLKRNLKILEALNDLLETGAWEKSLFLKATGKKIREIRDQFKANAEFPVETAASTLPARDLASRIAASRGQIEIFLSLYNADGSNFTKWEKLLVNIIGQGGTRPVYTSEKDVREIIRSKIKKKNEAYVSILVNQSDIVQPADDKVPHDSMHHNLLILKDKALKPENIIRFVHQTGTYQFKDEHLVRQDIHSDTEFI